MCGWHKKRLFWLIQPLFLFPLFRQHLAVVLPRLLAQDARYAYDGGMTGRLHQQGT